MTQQKWNRDVVIETIKRLHEAGSRLDYSFVHKNERSLLWAAEKYIGKWDIAVETAGLDADSVRVKPKRIKWSSEKVVEEIKKLNDSDLPLNSNYIQTMQRRLYGASLRYFASWPAAVEAAGFSYVELKKRDPRPISIERVVGEIKNRLSQGKPVNGGVVCKEDRGLYSRAKRCFPEGSSWDRALRAAGVNPKSLADPKLIWSRALVLLTIKDMFEKGEFLSGSFLAKNNLGGLYGAGKRIFGSWQATIEAADLDYDEVCGVRRNYWTPERLILEIKAYEASGKILSLKSTQNERADLIGAAIKHFGTWGLAVEAAGFDYQAHCKVRSTKFWLSKLNHSGYESLITDSLTRNIRTRNSGGKTKRKGNN